MCLIAKPHTSEYPAYSHIYMDLLDLDGNILDFMRKSLEGIKKLIYSLPEEKLNYRYTEGKWTIKEILVHIIDDERIFSYRALRYARNDETPLPGFEQDEYVRYSGANERSLDSIFEEYEAVRQATITLFKYLSENALLRSGSGIGPNKEIMNRRTVRALAFHIAGHEQRHIKIIRERYL